MENLTTEEVKFLISKDGVVTTKLLTGWEDKQKNSLDHNFKKEWSQKISILIAQIAGVVSFTVMQFMIDPADSFLAKICGVAILFCSWITINGARQESGLTNQLNNLQGVFRTYGRKEIRDYNYYLNRSWKWLMEEAEWILSTLAKRLKDAEESDGSESTLAQQFRKEFKSCHAVFVPLGLCDGDQGKWLGKSERKENVPKNPPLDTRPPASQGPIAVCIPGSGGY